MIHKCRHGSVALLCTWCMKQSLIFPVEHLLWERAPLFRTLTHLIGL
jgi:hypothetical protein